jgi:hypothetical protein
VEVYETTCGHGRTGAVDRDQAKCDRCKVDKLCLGFDSSEGEYGGLYLCRDCIMELFDN